MNIKLLLEDFCVHAQYIRGVSRSTLSRYRQNIMVFCRNRNITTIEEITEKLVYSYFLHGRVERKWCTRTYHTYYQSLKVFFRWCVKNGHMSENFAEKLELPQREKLLPKKLKKEDAVKLLEITYNYPYTQDFARYRNHALFAMYLYAGLRKNEALNLSLQDVDIENLSIMVRLGKGNKDRIVPMSTTLAQILYRYLKERKKARKTCPEFFACSNKDKGFTEHGLKNVVDLLRKVSGISFTIHRLRHTFATLMLEGGCDIFSLSKMLGHSDIKITTNYLSTTALHLKAQVTKHPLNTHFL